VVRGGISWGRSKQGVALNRNCRRRTKGERKYAKLSTQGKLMMASTVTSCSLPLSLRRVLRSELQVFLFELLP
jgi:hypothetical protein